MAYTEFKLPEFNLNTSCRVNILDFGAVPDGVTRIDKAFEKAVLYLSEKGGGSIVFPKGSYLSGAIHFKDNINIHLEKGSYILFTDEKEAYLPVVFTAFEGIRCYNYSPLIYARGCKNISLTGEGTIDGNGASWWHWKENDKGVNAIYIASANDTPVEERVYGSEAWGLRPCFVQLVDCENVLIEGISIKNAPFWTVHPLWCKNVIVRSLTLDSPFESPNTDGINIEGCDTVLVEDCNIISGGDDCFTLKSGRGTDGWNVQKPCRNVVIRNSTASDVRGGGIVIGSEMSGGVENVYAYGCVFKNIMNGIKIKSKKGRGGFVKDLKYENITTENLTNAINFTLKYSYDDIFSGNTLEAMPDVRDIEVSDFTCKRSVNGFSVEGVDGCHIKNVYLKNIYMTDIDNHFLADHVDNLVCENIKINN